MNEYEAKNALRTAWELENRSIKLDSLEAYTLRHLNQIWLLSGEEWDNVVASEYLKNLRQSI